MDPLLIANLAWILAVVVDFLIRIAALIIIPRDRKPSAAMAWLLCIFFIPYAGVIFFLLLGGSKLPRKRREKQAAVNVLVATESSQVNSIADPAGWPPWLASVTVLHRNLGAVPAVSGNSAHLIDGYDRSLADMAAEIDTATTFVHVEFYIVSFDQATREFFSAMEAAVGRGAIVRLLLDHVASVRATGHKETCAELDRIGVR